MAFQQRQGSEPVLPKMRRPTPTAAPPPAGQAHAQRRSYSAYNQPSHKRGRGGFRWFFPLFVLLGFLTGAAFSWGIARPDWSIRLPANLSAPLSWGSPATVSQDRTLAKAARFTSLPLPVATSQPTDPFALHPLVGLSYVPSIMYHDVVGSYKQVWFDTTQAELRQHFEAIREAGVTPISIDQLYQHLQLGDPLPPKAILLTFDDAYLGQYEFAYPLLKEFNYPAAYFVQTAFVGVPTSKDHFTWEQMQQMDREGLVSFAAHTVSHPSDLRALPDDKLQRELVESKRLMEEKLGHAIEYFAYPEGNRDARVIEAVKAAGYKMAFTMDTGFTGQSPNLLEVRRFNQFRLTEAIVGAKTLASKANPAYELEVSTPLQVKTEDLEQVRTLTIRGGRMATVHADQRYNVGTLVSRYQATAGINGSFFSIPWINASSNVMIGPVMSANSKVFIPGRPEDDAVIRGRPLVLLGQDRLQFVPFDPDTMNSLEEIQRLMPDVTDLFVGGLWLVRDGQPLTPAQLDSFRLSSAAEFRPRAFLGVDQDGLVVAGVTKTHVNAAILATILPKTGIQEAILLDSGFSTSLIYEDEILATGHATASQPSRPVPHVILLYDLPKLWQTGSPEGLATPPDRLESLISSLPTEQQASSRAVLSAVLSGQQVLRRGDRGSAVAAVQIGLARLAASQGQTGLLPSGPDGVYGRELGQALMVLGLTIDTTASSTSSSLPSASPTPLAGPGSAPLVTEFVDTLDASILNRLLDQVQQAPPAVLVSTTLTRQPPDLSRKPSRKPLS
ncbi:MAG: polysaccharide deacetylase family protein [Cyanobacteriota bacterium]|nr:polysaccharide deacetylase family protein [Cyanobacteriota bacterium]